LFAYWRPRSEWKLNLFNVCFWQPFSKLPRRKLHLSHCLNSNLWFFYRSHLKRWSNIKPFFYSDIGNIWHPNFWRFCNRELLFKTLGTIKWLCVELVVVLNFLLDLLRKPSSFMYLATVILIFYCQFCRYSRTSISLFWIEIDRGYYFLTSSTHYFLSEIDPLFHWK
jgi:hypothetical protein